MKKSTLIIGSLLSSIIFGSMTAHADEGKFTIHPTYAHHGNKGWIIQNISSGTSVKDSVTIENLSDREQKFSLALREATNENEKFTPKESTDYQDVGLWTKLSQTELTLAPNEKIKIPFEITVPENAFEKKYNGVMYAVKEENNDQNVKIVTRIGVRMYINVMTPNMLQTNIFNSPIYKNSLFFILSLVGLMGSAGYNLIHIIENKKYEKKTRVTN